MSGSGVVFNIARFSLHDGPGIRTVVFLKGCPLSCAWCHNPEGMSARTEVFFRPDKCLGCGRCAAVCPRVGNAAVSAGAAAQDAARARAYGDGAAAPSAPASAGPAARAAGTATAAGTAGAVGTATAVAAPFPGESCPPGCQACAAACQVGAREAVGVSWSVDALLEAALADRAFYDVSGGGVTLSGGDPAMQADFAAEFLEACGKAGLHRAVETSGFAPERAFLKMAERADLLLYDVKLLDPDAHRAWIGVDNALILNNLRSAAKRGSSIRLRRPLIPGVNDGAEEMGLLADLALELGVGVDILPYHDDAEDKYRKRRKPYRLEGMKAPSAQAVSACAAALSARGVDVRIGG